MQPQDNEKVRSSDDKDEDVVYGQIADTDTSIWKLISLYIYCNKKLNLAISSF